MNLGPRSRLTDTCGDENIRSRYQRGRKRLRMAGGEAGIDQEGINLANRPRAAGM